MAKIKINPAYRSVSGKFGDIVICNRNGEHFMRRYVVPANPDTPSQKHQRGRFKDAVKAWHELSHDGKITYNIRARKKKLCISGYNLFVSEYLKKQV